jgi:hypothetical protein
MQIDITKLTPAQLAQVADQLKAKRKLDAGDVKARWAIIDRMLAEKDGDAFKHTTADILTELQTAKIVRTDLTKDDRAEWLKKIQTRKQHLEKLTDESGKLVHAKGTLGYRPSAGGFTMTPDRVVDYIIEHGDKLSPADKAAILKALK